MHVFTGSCCSAEMINGTSRLLLRKETSLLMRNLEVGVETQMKNVIISSRMWLGLALAVILGAITQTLPSSLAVDKGPVAAGPTIANLVTTHSRASLRPELIANLAARNGSDLSSWFSGFESDSLRHERTGHGDRRNGQRGRQQSELQRDRRPIQLHLENRQGLERDLSNARRQIQRRQPM